MKKFHRRKFKKPSTAPAPRGLVLWYYGDGKGKTTAAIGVAVRARGAGLRVCVVQFMKTAKWLSHERQSLKILGIPVKILGSGFVGILDDKSTEAEHKKQALLALAETKKLLLLGKYDLIVADEIGSAVDEKLLKVSDLVRLVKSKPKKTHLVLTGHTTYPTLEKVCDLITLMKNKKHPFYTEGMLAQRGVDF
ncbi:MAG: cob(I)yrinic acid a,c-diamide adenosyltransferase [bacterium]|nr:cob(I)yrinic acid a,c-diamide adenosyltransferase [bacterium]